LIVGKVSKYLAKLQSTLPVETICNKVALTLEGKKIYENIVWVGPFKYDAFVFGTPDFNYVSYSAEYTKWIPCVKTEAEFKAKLAAINITDAKSWEAFSSCTLIPTLPVIPTPRVPNVYVDLRVPFTASAVKTQLKTAIDLSFSAKNEYNLKLAAIAKIQIDLDAAKIALNDELAKRVAIAFINTLALNYKNCVKPDSAPAEIIKLEKQLNALIKE